MAPTGQAHFDLAMGVLCSMGGAMGYAKKKSVPSLIGGLAFGAAYIGTAYTINDIDGYKGHAAGLATSALLTAVMGSRFAKYKKFMPAGLLAGAGLMGVLYHSKKVGEW
eukprot:CAMPEP_0202858432 /NCGR_PEP_ID=MMETSP1391-20130828/970_1 /ASSEMBLY_ACC=CAM_ASM_000867 /TAXON_ID=1034604 /ORGANISM="Chlamydomonas leiostraca, Strain SAG 11-49" /LENGTH=108 /DNA_ID=CAMNT_0049537353 /DNA_START=82 /DNA_END=405 /DNA_ORIENTATION=-